VRNVQKEINTIETKLREAESTTEQKKSLLTIAKNVSLGCQQKRKQADNELRTVERQMRNVRKRTDQLQETQVSVNNYSQVQTHTFQPNYNNNDQRSAIRPDTPVIVQFENQNKILH